MTITAAATGGHGHVITVAVTTGSEWLRVALIVGALVVASFALLRPFLGEPGRAAVLAVTGIAGAAVLLQLLLVDGLDVPGQVVVLLLAASAVPLVQAIRRGRLATPYGRVLRRVAPWVLVVAAGAAGAEFTRAWTGGENVTELVATALVIALVGLGWLTLCRPRTRRATVAVHVVAWVLANGLVAVTAHTAVLTTA